VATLLRDGEMKRAVYDDRYFQVIAPALPFNSRDDGGHLILVKKYQ
jgi:hypothetical protein